VGKNIAASQGRVETESITVSKQGQTRLAGKVGAAAAVSSVQKPAATDCMRRYYYIRAGADDDCDG